MVMHAPDFSQLSQPVTRATAARAVLVLALLSSLARRSPQRMRDHGRCMPPPRLRFAPSPTGPLHLGSAVVAVANALGARSLGGELLLRIDDTDAARTVADAEQGILDDLAWLGLEVAGEPVRQSERRELHLTAARECSPPRMRIAASARPRRSATTAAAGRSRAASAERRHEAGEPNVIRFRVPGAEVVVEDATRGAVRFAGDEISDFVLVRADGRPTFDLATSVDDRDLEITHIVRGEDHLANSARHLLLLRALGAVEPVFAHCPIIVGADGERLSTRSGAEPLAALRARGVPPEAVVAYAAQLACPAQGGAGEVASLAELAGRFSLARLGRGTAHADPAHLAWLGREVLAALPPTSSRAGSRRSCRRRRRPSCTLRSRRRRAAPRRSARSPTLLRSWHSVRPGRRRRARRSSSSASCARPTSARSCRTRRPSSSSTGCARSARAAASRPATCYTP